MVLKDDILIKSNGELPLLLKVETREKNNVTNKLIGDEIYQIKNTISKIIILTKANKNRLKKLYKKKKRINTNLIKFNRNKDKEFLKIIAIEIDTVNNNHKKLKKKIDINKNSYEKYKKIIFKLESENKYLKAKDKASKDFNQKIVFYQNENIRLSSKLELTKKQNIIINENLVIYKNKRNELIKLIHDLNSQFLDNNIIKKNFEKQKFEQIYDKEEINQEKVIKKADFDKNLNKTITEIFE